VTAELRELATIGGLLTSHGGNIKTGPFGTVLKAKEYARTGVPLISVGEIGYGSLRVHDSTPRVPREVVERLPDYLLHQGDIVFARKGAVDRLAMVKSEQAGWFLGSDGIRLRLPAACDARFIAYQLQSPESRSWLLQHAHGTTMASLNQSIIERLPIALPPLPEQRAIAAILGALDDKIELNRKMNRTLEAMAKAIFKSWFVDFDPVRAKMEGRKPYGMDDATAALFPDSFEESELGPVPKGWRVGKLGDACAINARSVGRDYPFEEIEYVDISSVTIGRLESCSRYARADAPSRARRLVCNGDTIWSCVRPNRRSYMFICDPVPNLVVSTGFSVISPKTVTPCYVHSWVTTDEFVDYLTANADGSAYPAVTQEHFAVADILLPPVTVLAQFDDSAQPLRNAIHANDQQSRALAGIRDALLPKLISGEIRIKDAEKLVEGAV
jgi:type I restriction enzyme S subunit